MAKRATTKVISSPSETAISSPSRDSMRVGIISSLIASLVFLIFFQPILNLLASFVVFIANNFVDTLSKSIYKGAALGQRNHVEVMILLLMLATMSSVQAGASIMIILRYLRKRKGHTPPTPSKYRLPFMLATGPVLAVMFLFSAAMIAGSTYTDLQLNTSFRQRLTVLAPLLTEEEEEQLMSEWASMKQRADYDAIQKRLVDLSQHHNVLLPDLLPGAR